MFTKRIYQGIAELRFHIVNAHAVIARFNYEPGSFDDLHDLIIRLKDLGCESIEVPVESRRFTPETIHGLYYAGFQYSPSSGRYHWYLDNRGDMLEDTTDRAIMEYFVRNGTMEPSEFEGTSEDVMDWGDL